VNRRRRRPGTGPATLAGLTLTLTTMFYALLGTGPSPAAHASVIGPEARAPTVSADPDGPGRSGLQLRVDSMSPRVVTATGPNILTVTGSVLNAGYQPVRNVEIRAQLSQRLRTEGDIRTALAGNAQDDAVTPGFTKLSPTLTPGTPVGFTLTVPLRGSATASLALQRTGVYELLLNVNGTPRGGDQTRLVGERMLLPVLGLPGADGIPTAAEPAAGGVAPRQVSLLYPLADQPRRLPTGPGEPMLLADDQLAGELAKGGRLDGLLAALETGAPVGSPVRAAICLAVDPDLLRTVADMSTGYQVRTPDGATGPGRGAKAAADWLARLRADAVGRCVVALPFADADLVALSRAQLPDLAGYATIEGPKLAGAILGTAVRKDTIWPADGLLDERSLNDYAKAGGHQVVLSADAVSGSPRPSGDGTVALSTPDAVSAAVLTDPLVSMAAAGGQTGTNLFGGRTGLGSLNSPNLIGSSLLNAGPTSPADQGGILSAQDAIGAIAFRAVTGRSSRSGPLLVAPPHQWNTSGADADALLDSVNTLITEGRLSPVTLPGGAGGPAASPGSTDRSGSGDDMASLVYPLRAGAREVPTSVTARLRTDRDVTAALRSAAIPAQGVGTTPAQVFDPVTQGLLRAASASWRGHPAESTEATRIITARVGLLRSLVRVVKPPTPYALGDEDAPLPLTLANGLPVGMQVRVLLACPPGLRVTSITPDPARHPIPPLGRLQLRASTELTRAGTFTVEARLATLDGTPLGPTSQLQLRSTVYGTITLWLTGTAGLLLVILAVRRIVRRLSGSLGPAAAGSRQEPERTSRTTDPPTGTDPPAGAGTANTATTTAATTTATTEGTSSSVTRTATSAHPAVQPATHAVPNTGGPNTGGPNTGASTRRPGSRQRDPVARRLGATAREEDEAAIRQGPRPSRPGPPPVRPEHRTPPTNRPNATPAGPPPARPPLPPGPRTAPAPAGPPPDRPPSDRTRSARPEQPRRPEQTPGRRIGAIPLGTQSSQVVRPVPPPIPPRTQPYPQPPPTQPPPTQQPPTQPPQHQPTRNGTATTNPQRHRPVRDDPGPESTQPVHPTTR
jgi:hypothetical protein